MNAEELEDQFAVAGYVVLCEDGPAVGFDYWTAIAPPKEILLVPTPVGSSAWMRVIDDVDPWPGQVRYRCTDERSETIDGDTVVHYYLVT